MMKKILLFAIDYKIVTFFSIFVALFLRIFLGSFWNVLLLLYVVAAVVLCLSYKSTIPNGYMASLYHRKNQVFRLYFAGEKAIVFPFSEIRILPYDEQELIVRREVYNLGKSYTENYSISYKLKPEYKTFDHFSCGASVKYYLKDWVSRHGLENLPSEMQNCFSLYNVKKQN